MLEHDHLVAARLRAVAPWDDDSDWEDVRARAAKLRRSRPRLRGRVAIIIAAAALLAVAAPAIAFRHELVRLFSTSPPAPLPVKHSFAMLDRGAPPGMAPHVEAGLARVVLRRPLGHDKTAITWAAPTRQGGFCTETAIATRSKPHPTGGGGGCDRHRRLRLTPQIMIPRPRHRHGRREARDPRRRPLLRRRPDQRSRLDRTDLPRRHPHDDPAYLDLETHQRRLLRLRNPTPPLPTRTHPIRHRGQRRRRTHAAHRPNILPTRTYPNRLSHATGTHSRPKGRSKRGAHARDSGRARRTASATHRNADSHRYRLVGGAHRRRWLRRSALVVPPVPESVRNGSLVKAPRRERQRQRLRLA